MADDEKYPYHNAEIHVEGNLTRDPEDKSKDKNGRFVIFSVACNFRTSDGTEGVTYYKFKALGEMGQNVLASLHAGEPVVVHAKGETREWTDSEDNVRRDDEYTVLSIGASLRWRTITFNPRDSSGSSRRSSSDDTGTSDEPASAKADAGPTRRRRRAAAEPEPSAQVADPAGDDDDDWE